MANNTRRFVIRIKKNNEKIRLVTWFAFLAVVCLPFHTLQIGGIGLLLLIGAPLLLLSMPVLLAQFKRTSWDSADIFLVAFFAYNVLGYVWTPSFSSYSLYNYVKIIVVVTCMYFQNYNRREKDFLMAGSVLSCMIVCWFMLTGRNVGYTEYRLTVTVFGVEQDPNYLGYLFLVPMGVLIQGFLNRKNVLTKGCCALLASVILFCVMMTGSRGAFLGLAVVVIVCVVMRFNKLSEKIAFCVLMALVAVLIYNFILMLLPENIVSRFSMQNVLKTGGTGRLDIWLDAIGAMQRAPYKLLFGFGTGSSIPVIGWATHNFLIQLLLELGIVGTGLFLQFLWLWSKRLMKQDARGLSIVMGCMALAMTLSVNTVYYFWFAFMQGIVCSKAKSGRKEAECP